MWLDTKAGYERLRERLKGRDFPRDRLVWPRDPDNPEERVPTVDLCDLRWRELVAAAVMEDRPTWVVINGLGDDHGDILLRHRIFEAMDAVAHNTPCAVTLILDHEGRLPSPGRPSGWAVAIRRMRTILAISAWAPDTADLRLRVTRTDGERPEPLRVRIVEGFP